MNPILKLHKECEGDGVVSLVIPRPSYGEKIRLCGRKGPLGQIMTGDDKRTIALFDRKQVRKFLERECPELF